MGIFRIFNIHAVLVLLDALNYILIHLQTSVINIPHSYILKTMITDE